MKEVMDSPSGIGSILMEGKNKLEEKPRPNAINIINTFLLSIVTIIFTISSNRMVNQLDALDLRLRVHEQLPFHPGTSVLVGQMKETQSDLKEDLKEVKKDMKEILKKVRQ